MLIIIDHGQGNIGSLKNSIRQLGKDFKVCSKFEDFVWEENVDGFILPGVGSFDQCMTQMRDRKLDKLIGMFIEKGIKGMGICLGMQILCETSEEGVKEKGLGIIKGVVKKLNPLNDKVPNMGWNKTYAETANYSDLKVLDELNGEFYYVHSYAVHTESMSNRVASFRHGQSSVTASIYGNKVLGVQFHPEKSQTKGLTLIQNYFS